MQHSSPKLLEKLLQGQLTGAQEKALHAHIFDSDCPIYEQGISQVDEKLEEILFATVDRIESAGSIGPLRKSLIFEIMEKFQVRGGTGDGA
jgi:hypothetical protein